MIAPQIVQKIPTLYETQRSFTAITTAQYLSLFLARSIQSTPPNPISWRSILILFTNLRLTLPIGLFPSGCPAKNIYVSLLSPIRVTCPAHLMPLDFITRIILGDVYISCNCSLRTPFPCQLVLFMPNYLPQHSILKHPQFMFLQWR